MAFEQKTPQSDLFKYRFEILFPHERATENVWEIPMQGVMVNPNTGDASG